MIDPWPATGSSLIPRSCDRRQFLMSGSAALGVACGALGVGSSLLASTPATSAQAYSQNTESDNQAETKICVFTKPLQELEYAQLAELLSKWPVAGVEATVRAGGQIEPAVASEQLPKMHEILLAKDRAYMILATDVTGADHPDVGRVLEVAAKLGIVYFRMGYFQYKKDNPVLPQLDSFAKRAQELAVVCGQLGMTALYQNHAGSDYVGAPIWDLVQVLNGIPKEQIAVAFDIRHATVESTTAWPLAYSSIREHIGAIFVKDAIVDRDKVRDVPLGQGHQARALFQRIRADRVQGPLSLHMEHIDHRDPSLLSNRIEATAQDISTLREWLADMG